MANPWEKYQQADAGGPWAKYAQQTEAAPAPEQPAPVMVGGEDAATMPAWKNAAYGLVSPVASAIVGAGQMTGLMDDKTAQESLARIDAVRSRTPGKVAGFVGDVGMFALAPEAKLANAGRLAKLVQTGAQGAALGGIQGTREGESRAMNAGFGAALNTLGQGASDALLAGGKSAAKAIGPEVRAIYEAAKARGITLSPAQLSDSRAAKYVESVLQGLPFSGVASKAAEQKSIINRRIAEAIGVDAPIVTPEVYAAKKAADSAKFEELTSRNNLAVTPELARKLHHISQIAKTAGKDVHDAVNEAIDGLYSQMRDGIVPGRAYQALDSALGQVTKLGTPVSHFVGQVKHAVRDAMDDSISPADREAWRKLRQEYGNRKTIRDLVAKGDGGELSPTALMQRVNANNAGKEAMASGTRGELGELARIGQRMKEPPNSGTADRLAVQKAFNPLNWPGLTLASVAGLGSRAVNNAALTKIMMREGRGKLPQYLAPYARPALAALLMPEPERNP